MVQRDANAKLAVQQYTQIVQKYRDYPRTDEVLFFLAHNLMDLNEEKKALIAYGKLVKDYPKSRFVPDAYLAFGEYYFNNSKGRRDWLVKALEAYKSAANYPESQIYGFALYKQGWCYFNLTDYSRAMDLFKATVLYGEFTGASALEKQGGAKGKNTLIREARNDYVRAYERAGLLPQGAKENFSTVASNPDDRFSMMEQLASLYYDAGKDREAALAYSFLIKEKPLIAKTPGFQSRIVDCVLRAGNKKQTVAQVRQLVKVINDVEASGNVKTDADRKAMASARDLSERTLSNLAVNWHNEGRKTRDDDTFEYANEVYADYLVLFPDNKKSYDLHFFWAELLNDNLHKYPEASEQYTTVVVLDGKAIDAKAKPGKWLSNAAFNAVYSADEVVRRAEQKGELKPPSGPDLKTAVPFAPQRKVLLDACERYLKYLPKGEKRVEIAYKAAKIYYDYNHYDEAVIRFSEIALTAPDHKFDNGDRAGEIAANLVLDSYNALGDCTKVNEWARRFYANDKLATGKFKEELAKVIEQSSFKLVNQLEEKNEYAAAARRTWTSSRSSPARRSPTRRSTTPPSTSSKRTCWRRRSPPASSCSAITRTARWCPPASGPTPRATRRSATSSTPRRPTSSTSRATRSSSPRPTGRAARRPEGRRRPSTARPPRSRSRRRKARSGRSRRRRSPSSTPACSARAWASSARR